MGTGWVATARHIPAFRSHPDVEITSVFDRKIEKAEATAKRFHVPHWSASEREFLDQELDVVTICTPPWTHAELACAAFDRGLHVFTEKPMAMNVADAEAMLAAADRAQRLLCVSHNFLFSRSVAQADRLLNGDSSSLQYGFGMQLSSSMRRLPDWYQKLPGGLFLDESPHMIYTLQHFLGELQLESCRATWNSTTRLPKSIDIQLRGVRATGQLNMLFEAPVSEWHVGLVSRTRAMDLDLFRDIIVSVKSDGGHKPADILRTSFRAIRDHVAGFVQSGARYSTHRLYWGHDVIIRKFIDATLGRGPVPVDPKESVGVVRLTDEILVALALR
jgi:predicted dehydrogenase